MKKIFSLFAAVLFAGSMMAAESLQATLDFTGTAWNIPTSGTNTEAAQFTDGTYTITLAAATNYKQNSGYLILGKQGSTLTLPAFTWKTTKIRVTGSSGASESVKQNIFVGETAVSTETTGAKNVTNEYAIAAAYQAAGNVYVLKVTSSHNTQITKIEVYGEAAPAGDIFTVAGEPTTVFGTTWDLTNTANDMAKQTDGSYKWEKTGLELGAGTVAFKVVKNRDWNNGANAWPAENYNLAIAEAGIYTITITFEPENENAVKATATKTGEAVVVPTVIMHGTFTGSWADTEAFAKAEDKKTASLKLTLAAGDIEFGLKLDGAWKANGATITRENASTSLASGEGNMHLTADVAGDYTFTYTYETQTLAVTFPALPISLTEFITNKPAEAVTLKDLTVIFATGKNTYVIDEDGVALVIYDANKTYYDGTLAAGKVLSGQKATYTSYKNQDEIIPANAANVSDGTAPEAELRTEAPTVADINKFIAFNNVAAEKASNNNYYIFDGAVQLYFASSSDKPSEDGNYDVEGVFINYNSTQFELIVTAIEKSKGTAIDNATVATKAQKMIIDGQLFIIRDGVMFNANGAAVK